MSEAMLPPRESEICCALFVAPGAPRFVDAQRSPLVAWSWPAPRDGPSNRPQTVDKRQRALLACAFLRSNDGALCRICRQSIASGKHAVVATAGSSRVGRSRSRGSAGQHGRATNELAPEPRQKGSGRLRRQGKHPSQGADGARASSAEIVSRTDMDLTFLEFFRARDRRCGHRSRDETSTRSGLVAVELQRSGAR